MILLIDDDIFGMKPYRLALESAGFEVASAEDPDVALSALREHAEDLELIVLDVMMPSGQALKDEDVEQGLRTGRVLLSRIREEHADCPVIVLSITSVDDFGVKDVEFLHKADTLPSELVEIVKETIGKHRGTQVQGGS